MNLSTGTPQIFFSWKHTQFKVWPKLKECFREGCLDKKSKTPMCIVPPVRNDSPGSFLISPMTVKLSQNIEIVQDILSWQRRKSDSNWPA